MTTREEREELPFWIIFRSIDKVALLCTLGVFFMGLLSIYSATHSRGNVYLLKQMLWGAVASMAYLVALAVGYRRFFRYAYPLYGIALGALVLVLFIGAVTKGAQSWFSLGPLRLQPSELVKVALALVLGKHLCRYPPTTLRSFCIVLGLAGASSFLVLLQPDLGSVLVYGSMTLVALLVAGTPWRYLGGLLGAVGVLSPLAWMFLLKGYQKMRLLVFLDPHADPLGAGYNVIQSRIAVGSGGLFGKGFLEGTQASLRFLPEPHTDFIFSVFAEEFGFLGCCLLLAFFVLLLWRTLRGGLVSKDLRSKVLVGALTGWIAFQAMESIAMSIGWAPITGLPLPLFSYGGSSLLSMGLALGIAQSVYVESPRSFS
ncbi:MAG TPA: rod shape-determining protein RodA [Synergistaceae bacterium]|nr:rod shape-determining protein RodA [Synergistaceae bacterium]HPJ24744.1 rod shape-determining protein RodA [Synergistaceae bacterium]HPQ37085.1 rod shape-determining protein RodA [Synergistaceae bacterium]